MQDTLRGRIQRHNERPAAIWSAALRADFTAFHAGFATDAGIGVPRTYWLALGERV